MTGSTYPTVVQAAPTVVQAAPIAGLVVPTAAQVAAWADWAATAVAQRVGTAAQAAVAVARVLSIPDPASSIGVQGAASIVAQGHSHLETPVSAGDSPRCPVAGNHRVAEVGS